MGKKANIDWLQAKLDWARAKILQQEPTESKRWWISGAKTQGDIRREQEVTCFVRTLQARTDSESYAHRFEASLVKFDKYKKQAAAIVENSFFSDDEKQEQLVLLYRKEQLAKKYPEDKLYLDGSASRREYNHKSYSHFGLEYLKVIVANLEARLEKAYDTDSDIDITDLQKQIETYHDLVKNPFDSKYRRGSKYRSRLDMSVLREGEVEHTKAIVGLDRVLGYLSDASKDAIREQEFTYRDFSTEEVIEVAVDTIELKSKVKKLDVKLVSLEKSLQQDKKEQLKLPQEIKDLKINLKDIAYLIDYSQKFGSYAWNIHLQKSMYSLGFEEEYNRLWGNPQASLVVGSDGVTTVQFEVQKVPSTMELKNFVDRLSIIQSIIERELQAKKKRLNKLDKRIKFGSRLRDMEADLLSLYQLALDSTDGKWSSEQQERLELMEQTVRDFKANPHASQFVNGGDIVWGTALYRDARVPVVKEPEVKEVCTVSDEQTAVSGESFTLRPEGFLTDSDDDLSMSIKLSTIQSKLEPSSSSREWLLTSLDNYLKSYDRAEKSDSFLDKIYLMLWGPSNSEIKTAQSLKKIVQEQRELSLSQIKCGLYYNLNMELFNNNPRLRESFLDYLFRFEFSSNNEARELIAVANATLARIPQPSWWQFWKEDEYLNKYLSLQSRIMRIEERINPDSPGYIGYGDDKVVERLPLNLIAADVVPEPKLTDESKTTTLVRPVLMSQGLSKAAESQDLSAEVVSSGSPGLC